MLLMKAVLNRLTRNRARKKINKRDGDKFTPFHYAARYNRLDMCELLLERGAGNMIRVILFVARKLRLNVFFASFDAGFVMRLKWFYQLFKNSVLFFFEHHPILSAK